MLNAGRERALSTRHDELDCSDDVEILEIYSSPVHPVVVEAMPAGAPEPAAAGGR